MAGCWDNWRFIGHSHRHPRVLSIRVGEIFLCLISINSPTHFDRRGISTPKSYFFPGFVWRRMTHDTEDLPSPRAPHLGKGAAPWIHFEQQQQLQQHPQRQQQYIPLTRALPVASAPPYQPSQHHHHDHLPPLQVTFPGVEPHRTPNPKRTQSFEDDATSITSFKTCPSDPNLMANLVPRQISDNYEDISRLHRSRDGSVMSGASEVTISPAKFSKRPSFQSGSGTPLSQTRPRLKETD